MLEIKTKHLSGTNTAKNGGEVNFRHIVNLFFKGLLIQEKVSFNEYKNRALQNFYNNLNMNSVVGIQIL